VLDYYTAPVYETQLVGFESYGSICSGGRYDALASDGRRHIPGSALHRPHAAARQAHAHPVTQQVQSLVRPGGPGRRGPIGAQGCGVAAALRRRGIPCEVAPVAARFGKQIKFARATRHTVRVGSRRQVTRLSDSVKDIRSGAQAMATHPPGPRPMIADLRPVLSPHRRWATTVWFWEATDHCSGCERPRPRSRGDEQHAPGRSGPVGCHAGSIWSQQAARVAPSSSPRNPAPRRPRRPTAHRASRAGRWSQRCTTARGRMALACVTSSAGVVGHRGLSHSVQRLDNGLRPLRTRVVEVLTRCAARARARPERTERCALVGVLLAAGADMDAALGEALLDHRRHVHERFDGDPGDPSPSSLRRRWWLPGRLVAASVANGPTPRSQFSQMSFQRSPTLGWDSDDCSLRKSQQRALTS
jgi:hypothetical protein